MDHFLEMEQSFGLVGKIDNVITYNASNMKKAFRLLEISEDTDELEDDDEDELDPLEVDDDLKLELERRTNHYGCFTTHCSL